MTFLATLVRTRPEGWFRLNAAVGVGKYLRRLCRMAYGIHLHAPMRGCHITIAPPGRRPELVRLLGHTCAVTIRLGEWWTNGNAVWTPVECRVLDGLWRVRQDPHLCIGYLTQEATRPDTWPSG